MDVTVIVATFGDKAWIDIADKNAMVSLAHLDVPIVRLHGGSTLAQSRNTAASLAETEWLCFLDADDYLGAGYFEEMASVTGDVRVPRLFFIEGASAYEPFDLTQRDMENSNPCPIGSLIRKDMFMDIGGFWEEPIYEDWSLFRRAWLAGASIEHTDAKYYSNNIGGRNESIIDPSVEYANIKLSHFIWQQARK